MKHKYSNSLLQKTSISGQNAQSDKYKNFKIKDPEIKGAMNVLNINIRTNFYQKIHLLAKTSPKTWRKLEFLLYKDQVEVFVEKIKKEIELIKTSKFDYHKYRAIIIRILGDNSGKLFNNAEMIKNAFIAKLTSIILLLKETIEDNNSSIKEVKNTNKSISR